MTARFSLPLIALAALAPLPLAAQSTGGFQLPPAPTPTATPNVQGPVDTESGAVPVRPRAIPTARPTAAPTTQASPVLRLPESDPAPTRAAPTRPAPTLARPTPQASATPRPEPATPPAATTALPAPTIEATPEQPVASPAVPAASPASPLPSPTVAPAEPVAAEPASNFGLVAAIIAALAALGTAAFLLWRRKARHAAPPEIERPIVASAEARAGLADIRMAADAVKLTRSMAYATLDYQVTLMNRSRAAASDIVLSADLVTAHGGAPVESQIASSEQSLETRHTFARISPGQTVRHEGKLQIPLGQARIIRQGNASLIVPLLRVRLDRAGEAPIVKTFVVGQGIPGGGRVAPFRLEDGPRSYAPIAAREIDSALAAV